MSKTTLPQQLEDRLTILEFIKKMTAKPELTPDENRKLEKARAAFARLDKSIDADLLKISTVYIAPPEEDENY